MKTYIAILCTIIPLIVFSQGKIIAHRGASSIFPENTIAAFSKAIELGVGFIEVDLQLSMEDSIMVIHDETLNRTTNGSGNVNEFNYQQLKELSAGYSNKFGSDFINEKIPSLFEVLKLAEREIKVCIDLKKTPEYPVIELVKKMNMTDQVYLMSYNAKKLRRIRSIDPQIKTILIKNTLTTIDLEVASEIGAFGVSGAYISPVSLIRKAHDKGLEFWVGIISDPGKAESLLRYNVDAVITDHPQLMTMSTEREVFISPNPFREEISIRFINPERVQEVCIIDNQGSIIQKFNRPYNNPIIWQPGSRISKGIFLVYFIMDEEIFFEKILYY